MDHATWPIYMHDGLDKGPKIGPKEALAEITFLLSSIWGSKNPETLFLAPNDHFPPK
jgi:hypothetical protein